MKVITKCLDKTSDQRSASWHVVSISEQVGHTPYGLALEPPQLWARLLQLSFQISHQNIEQDPEELRASRSNFLINPEVILMVFLRDGFSFVFQLLKPSFQDRVTLDPHKAVSRWLLNIKILDWGQFLSPRERSREPCRAHLCSARGLQEGRAVHTCAVPTGSNTFRLRVWLPITLLSNGITWVEFLMVFLPSPVYLRGRVWTVKGDHLNWCTS